MASMGVRIGAVVSHGRARALRGYRSESSHLLFTRYGGALVGRRVAQWSSKHNHSSPSRVCSQGPMLIVRAGAMEPLDLTVDNVERVLLDARTELLQLFDTSVGITGIAELADLDGPFLKLRLRGRFWHQRSVVLARLANYLQQRIPEIVAVEIEDESQLDDSAANFGYQ